MEPGLTHRVLARVMEVEEIKAVEGRIVKKKAEEKRAGGEKVRVSKEDATTF